MPTSWWNSFFKRFSILTPDWLTENRRGRISSGIYLAYCTSSRQVKQKLFKTFETESPLMFESLLQTSPSSRLSVSPLIVCSCFILQVSFVFTFFCLSWFKVPLSFVSPLLLLLVAQVCSLTQVNVLTLTSHTCLAVFPNFVVTSKLNSFIFLFKLTTVVWWKWWNLFPCLYFPFILRLC